LTRALKQQHTPLAAALQLQCGARRHSLQTPHKQQAPCHCDVISPLTCTGQTMMGPSCSG
jgi:hypothetical protein